MHRLGKHLGMLGRLRIRIQRHRRKAGDEHDLDVRIELDGGLQPPEQVGGDREIAGLGALDRGALRVRRGRMLRLPVR